MIFFVAPPYDSIQALGQVLVSRGVKMKNLVDPSNTLITPIYRLGGAFQTKFMQMKAKKSDFVFSPIYLYCKK